MTSQIDRQLKNVWSIANLSATEANFQEYQLCQIWRYTKILKIIDTLKFALIQNSM